MSCACYCPVCGVDLVTEPGTMHTDTDLVRYNCGACGTRSEWLFDAPVPLLISPRLERLANRSHEQGRSLWDAAREAMRAVRDWPLWKRGQR
jgi:hypothetical protein